MTRAEELLEEWESGDTNGMRPARIQRLREELQEITGQPIPRRVPAIESWLEAMKPQLTRKLREAVDDEIEDADGD